MSRLVQEQLLVTEIEMADWHTAPGGSVFAGIIDPKDTENPEEVFDEHELLDWK